MPANRGNKKAVLPPETVTIPSDVTTHATGGVLPERPHITLADVSRRLSAINDAIESAHTAVQAKADTTIARAQSVLYLTQEEQQQYIDSRMRKAASLVGRSSRNVRDYIDGRLAGHYAIAHDYGIHVPSNRPKPTGHALAPQPSSSGLYWSWQTSGDATWPAGQYMIPYPCLPPQGWQQVSLPGNTVTYEQWQANYPWENLGPFSCNQPGGGCPQGTHLDPSTGLCIPDLLPVTCPAGEHPDPITGVCVPDSTCPAGMQPDPITGLCTSTCTPAEPCPPSCPPVMSVGDSCDNPLFVQVCEPSPASTPSTSPWWCVDGVVSQSDSPPAGDDVIGPYSTQSDADATCAYYQETHQPKQQQAPQYGGDIAWATDENSDDQVDQALADIGVDVGDPQAGQSFADAYAAIASSMGVGSYSG